MPDDDSESLALVGEEDPLSKPSISRTQGTKERQSTKFCAERRRLTP